MGLLHDLIWGKPVNGGGSEGGGGSSDFSTAEVTVRVVTDYTGDFAVLLNGLITLSTEGDSFLFANPSFSPNQTTTVAVVLYDGKSNFFDLAIRAAAGISLSFDYDNIAFAGGVSLDEDEESFIVRGDGEITIPVIQN